MEPIQHTHHQPRKKSSTKINLTISLAIHLLIFVLGAVWAAHEGVLGKKLQELSVGLLPKEKKPAEDPKKAEAKAEGAKKNEDTKPAEQARATTPPPPKFLAPAAANEGAAPPPAVELGDFVLDRDAIAGGDDVGLYRQQVENILRARWDRPSDLQDLDFVAEVELRLDSRGRISGYDWKKGSGNPRWDDSVKKSLAGNLNRPPPRGFPGSVVVRFDVQETPDGVALSSGVVNP